MSPVGGSLIWALPPRPPFRLSNDHAINARQLPCMRWVPKPSSTALSIVRSGRHQLRRRLKRLGGTIYCSAAQFTRRLPSHRQTVYRLLVQRQMITAYCLSGQSFTADSLLQHPNSSLPEAARDAQFHVEKHEDLLHRHFPDRGRYLRIISLVVSVVAWGWCTRG